mmetsp:Transcript_11317/g.27475  ORF Transcript_11317/g.27475 Transcript_11317/m.27475 type:complete len:326 (+) Transcript_11317:2426-3403(+)
MEAFATCAQALGVKEKVLPASPEDVKRACHPFNVQNPTRTLPRVAKPLKALKTLFGDVAVIEEPESEEMQRQDPEDLGESGDSGDDDEGGVETAAGRCIGGFEGLFGEGGWCGTGGCSNPAHALEPTLADLAKAAAADDTTFSIEQCALCSCVQKAKLPTPSCVSAFFGGDKTPFCMEKEKEEPEVSSPTSESEGQERLGSQGTEVAEKGQPCVWESTPVSQHDGKRGRFDQALGRNPRRSHGAACSRGPLAKGPRSTALHARGGCLSAPRPPAPTGGGERRWIWSKFGGYAGWKSGWETRERLGSGSIGVRAPFPARVCLGTWT